MAGIFGSILGFTASTMQAMQAKRIAEEQRAKSLENTKLAERLRQNPIQKEYYDALRMAQMSELSPSPMYEQQKAQTEIDTANALKSIQESSPYGGNVAAAIVATKSGESKLKSQLAAQEQQNRIEKRRDVMQAVQGIGGLKEQKTQEWLNEKAKLKGAAESLMQAYYGNAMNATNYMAEGIKTLGSNADAMAAGGAKGGMLGGLTGGAAGDAGSQLQQEQASKIGRAHV